MRFRKHHVSLPKGTDILLMGLFYLIFLFTYKRDLRITDSKDTFLNTTLHSVRKCESFNFLICWIRRFDLLFCLSSIYLLFTFFIVHSYLNASTGFSSEAFFAGTRPAISPTSMETMVATTVPFRLRANSNGTFILTEIRKRIT